jgi:hypothetical protein
VAVRRHQGQIVNVVTATVIGLEVPCAEPICTQFAWPLFDQLREGDYDECAVLPLTGSHDWRGSHRTARKRADRALRRGYVCGLVERHTRSQDVLAINLSASHRQGRPMSDGYRQPPTTTPLPDYPCPRHGVHTYGVFLEEALVAYCWIYRAGDLALVSQILGHAAHLENEIMYLLVQGVVAAESKQGGFLVYNRWDSGTEGLRFFKQRCGFQPTMVEWSQW